MTRSLDPSVYVHPQALCESDEIGARTRIWAFAHVMKGARIGSDCNVCDHAFVESGAIVGDHVTIKNGVQIWDRVTVGDWVFLGPSVIFTNDLNPRAAFKKAPDRFLSTRVENGVSIGANSTIVSGVTLREGAFVGAGATVIADVPAYALVVGNPARRIGWMCACGTKLPASLECGACERKYRLDGERTGLAPR